MGKVFHLYVATFGMLGDFFICFKHMFLFVIVATCISVKRSFIIWTFRLDIVPTIAIGVVTSILFKFKTILIQNFVNKLNLRQLQLFS